MKAARCGMWPEKARAREELGQYNTLRDKSPGGVAGQGYPGNRDLEGSPPGIPSISY